jgi:sugar (pentulose or hexulose) kinase
LAGYIHYLLTGEKNIGIGDASGMFPIDDKHCDYDQRMVNIMNVFIKKAKLPYKFHDIFPKVQVAGKVAGKLTKEGALLIDSEGDLQPGVLFCAPEGDAGTGMVSTNSIKVATGNVSAGTSIFAMIVLKHNLSKWYKMIDIVNTPDGLPVAMIHCNNCSTDINL